ncbi:DciA family protein [Vibrio europaeus]|uniref:DUF721 domain-containing protein n=1 Tax=Vibrio europaeus TaxID=300876 RepID=A0A178JHE1_9VIBR|nr:DciA family protein [Vibrio europaeus]MDC5704418.1 DciA family protein [Vibrio europaeus]MDC5709048.1 DciA family protein [Vibrio europaeus]MDC5717612.1 DciA family protein [Vibrio europaeus]MDC5718681.1 DciA family protein [Vibrio europaeus]MDC5727887.1 DciA family protein [Vibrio europaeus]
MRDHRPTLGDEIIGDSRLSQLQQHAKEIMLINKELKSILPRGTEDHCRVANIRDNQLILEVASAGIKMKIDYERLSILNQLRSKGFARLIAVSVQINPELYRSKNRSEDKPKPRDPISGTAAQYLEMIATGASPKVKARLESLAKLAKKDQD